MLREHQKYSPANQAAAIAEYASARGYEVVRTYRDNGRSGLTLLRGGSSATPGNPTFGWLADGLKWHREAEPDIEGNLFLPARYGL
jgi:hypothetical protein